eukprot:SM000227S07452  [mRNA]  locus=s227:212947:219778:+ [translate_table: standard]
MRSATPVVGLPSAWKTPYATPCRSSCRCRMQAAPSPRQKQRRPGDPGGLLRGQEVWARRWRRRLSADVEAELGDEPPVAPRAPELPPALPSSALGGRRPARRSRGPADAPAASARALRCVQRVKVYRLNDDNKWDDKGTGHVTVEYLERCNAQGLVVIDEKDESTLLLHRIAADDIYQRQEDTIISWTDPEVATDLALSFAETAGCKYIWEHICDVQRQIQFPTVAATDNGPWHMTDELEHSGTSQDEDDAFHAGPPDLHCLPAMELSTLPQIAKVVCEVMPFHRDRVATLILREHPTYVSKLVELYHDCKDLDNTEGLQQLYRIVKGLILLNDGHILDILLSDQYIMDIIGALNHDPDLAVPQDHCAFLREQVLFKEAVPIRDEAILSKIHQTYRIGYIKDVILPRALDDSTFGTLNSLMLFNNVEVVTGLQNDKAFLSELFGRLRDQNTAERSWRELVSFLQEFCTLSKHLQPPQRNQLFGALIEGGVFDVVTKTMQHKDEAMRFKGTDILMSILTHDPSIVRSFLVDQPKTTLFSLLVKGMLMSSEGGLQVQLLEMMRMLLDSDTMDVYGYKQQAEKSEFLEVFYTNYMDLLLNAITNPTSPPLVPEIVGNIIELLNFCVQHHSFRIKNYMLRKNLVEKVLRLTKRRERFLVVAALRFLRTCIGLKDLFYANQIVQHSLFDPVVKAFLSNGSRYNLLNSAFIELVDFLRKENLRSLIIHLVEKHGDKLSEVDYVDSFQLLRLKYDQLMEGAGGGGPTAAAGMPGGEGGASTSGRDAGNGAAPAGGGGGRPGFMTDRRRRDERAPDKSEEDYFNEDSDEEEDTASAPAPMKLRQPPLPPAVLLNGGRSGEGLGLVDYEDEDEDEAAGSSPLREQPAVRSPAAAATGATSPGKRSSLSAAKEDKERGLEVKRHRKEEPPAAANHGTGVEGRSQQAGEWDADHGRRPPWRQEDDNNGHSGSGGGGEGSADPLDSLELRQRRPLDPASSGKRGASPDGVGSGAAAAASGPLSGKAAVLTEPYTVR